MNKKIFKLINSSLLSLFLISCDTGGQFLGSFLDDKLSERELAEFTEIKRDHGDYLNNLDSLATPSLIKNSPLGLHSPSVIFQMPSAPPGAVLPSDKVVDVGTEVTVDGSSSTGQDLTYRWNFDIFPVESNTKIDDPTASMIRFTPDVEGLYLVKLVVRDANNNSTPSYLAIRAVSSNTPPSFTLSYKTQSTGFPKFVRLRVRSRSDDGEIRLVEVDYGDGHQVVYRGREADSIGYNIDHYYQTSGSYTAKVTLIDDKGARTEESLVIDLSQDNQVPILRYSVNSTSGTAPFTLRVDATTSSDPDNNTPLHFYWEWGHGGAYAYTENLVSTYTYTEPGIYTVFALADDRAGGRVYNEFTIYVDDPDNPGTYSAPAGGSPPVLDIMATSPRVGTSPLTVNFDASRSFDLEGDTFEVFWHFDNFVFKGYDEGLRVSKTFKTAGTYEFRVGIRDSHGNEFIEYYLIHVYDTAADEEPKFFIEQRGPREFVMFFGNPLYEVSATYRNVFWDFGDNTYSRRWFAGHTYSAPGMYPVTLTVLDILGNRRTVSRILNVTGEEDDVKLSIEPHDQRAFVGRMFNLSGVHPDTGDPSLLDIFWSLGTGFKEGQSSITHNYDEKGLYRIRAHGTNENGVSAQSVAHATVISGIRPVPISKLSTYVGVAPLTVSFDGSYSRALTPGDDSLEHYWELGNRYSDLKKSSFSSNFSYTYETPENKYISHSVKNSNGNFDILFHKVVVLDPDDVTDSNMSPTVSLDRSHFTIDGLNVSTSAVFSDPDGSILFTEWDWGDRIVNVFRHNAGSVNHNYAIGGTYTVTVRVFDNMGAVTTATYELEVYPPPQSLLEDNRKESHLTSLNDEERKNLSENPSVALPWARDWEEDPAFLLEKSKHARFERDERAKTGCEMKSNGQARCYSSKDERGGEM